MENSFSARCIFSGPRLVTYTYDDRRAVDSTAAAKEDEGHQLSQIAALQRLAQPQRELVAGAGFSEGAIIVEAEPKAVG